MPIRNRLLSAQICGFTFLKSFKIAHYPFGFKMPRPSVFTQGGLDETEPTSAISGWALILEEFGVGNGSALIFYSVVDMVQKMVTDLWRGT